MAENVGDLVHGDVGIVNVPTRDGFRFYSLLKDDSSEFSDVKLLKQKSEAALHVTEFCEMLHTQTGQRVKKIRTNRGTEYEGKPFCDYKLKNGVIHQKSCRYTPQQNGVSERANRTLIDGVRSTMYNNTPVVSDTLQELWVNFCQLLFTLETGL